MLLTRRARIRLPETRDIRIEAPMKTIPGLSATRRRALHGLLRSATAAATCALAATLAHALPASPEEHVGINLERGEPARWAVPADTPQLKFEAEAKGIRAALAENLKDCRSLPAGRAACEADARAQSRHDLENARVVLSGATARTGPAGTKP
jgi:hypothetical protein